MGQTNSKRALTQADEEKDDYERNRSYHYHGYPKLAEWMASSPDFFLLRRYSTLAARSLLNLQHQLANVERELRELDEACKKEPYGQAGLDSIDHDPHGTERQALIDRATTLLREYYDLVNNFAQVRNIPTARPQHLENLENFFVTYPNAIFKDEQYFRNNKGDLFPILARDRSVVAQLMERWQWLTFRFTLKPREERTDRIMHEATAYVSDTGLQMFVSLFVLIAGLVLLFAPMWWLNFVSNDNYRLAIITGFVTLFAAWLWMVSVQRPFEALAGTAAYAAVLMVFLQSSGNGSTNIR